MSTKLKEPVLTSSSLLEQVKKLIESENRPIAEFMKEFIKLKKVYKTTSENKK